MPEERIAVTYFRVSGPQISTHIEFMLRICDIKS